MNTDRREDWLRAVANTFDWELIPRVAAVLSRHAGQDGQCEQTRRSIMAEVGIEKSYAYERAMRELEDAGLIYRENPGSASRTTAIYSLLLGGEFIAGGDSQSAPRLEPSRGWAYKIERSGERRVPKEKKKPLPNGDSLWLEPMSHCDHTLRTCSPECPEWGGRATASDFGLLEGVAA